MKCKHCGAEINDENEILCTECGRYLKNTGGIICVQIGIVLLIFGLFITFALLISLPLLIVGICLEWKNLKRYFEIKKNIKPQKNKKVSFPLIHMSGIPFANEKETINLLFEETEICFINDRNNDLLKLPYSDIIDASTVVEDDIVLLQIYTKNKEQILFAPPLNNKFLCDSVQKYITNACMKNTDSDNTNIKNNYETFFIKADKYRNDDGNIVRGDCSISINSDNFIFKQNDEVIENNISSIYYFGIWEYENEIYFKFRMRSGCEYMFKQLNNEADEISNLMKSLNIDVEDSRQ